MASVLRDRGKQEKLKRIRETAWALFRERGYERATTREIAERAGVGAGTLFLYAPDKSALLFLVFRDEIEATYTAALETLPRDVPLLASLVHVFGALVEHYAKTPELSRRFIRESLFLAGDLRVTYNAMNEAFFAALMQLVERAKERGEVRDDVSAMVLIGNVYAIYGFHMVGWLAGEGPHDPTVGRAALEPGMRLALEGVRPDVVVVGDAPKSAEKGSKRAVKKGGA